MIEAIKTILNGLVSFMRTNRPNWAQNDPDALDYIKNRPFYSEPKNVTVENVAGEELELNHFPVFAIGDTVTVDVDGVEYSLVAYDDDGYVTIGDTTSSVYSGEGQLGWQIYVAEDGVVWLYAKEAHTVSYLDIENPIIYKIDEKYLPDEVIDSIGIANNAQITANKAQTTANKAQTMVNSKMNASNPVGTGSFSMGRKSGTTIGGSSHAEGENTTASGSASHAEGYGTTASGGQSHAEGDSTAANGYCSHAEADSTAANGSYSHAEGHGTTAKLSCSHAEGENTVASGGQSHAEGYKTTASGNFSHAEGNNTTASGSRSHAEGSDTTAEADASHAEGYSTTASGGQSHAEGSETTASGNFSHAEGLYTTAKAECSHAEGNNTIASSSNQHVQGKYNVEDSQSKYAYIVGNGVSLINRSNAHTLDWNGVAWFQGRPQFGGTAQDQDSQTVMANGDKEIILTSSTEGSTKKFKIAVDDSGTITATEVTA